MFDQLYCRGLTFFKNWSAVDCHLSEIKITVDFIKLI